MTLFFIWSHVLLMNLSPMLTLSLTSAFGLYQPGFPPTQIENPWVCAGHERTGTIQNTFLRKVTVVYIDLTLTDVLSCWKCNHDGCREPDNTRLLYALQPTPAKNI